MQDSVKLLITFPESTNIEDVVARLRSDYVFPQQVKIVEPTKLSCSFETMADLLEIDFIKSFGATSTQVINSKSFSQQMNIKRQNFTISQAGSDSEYLQSSLGQFPNGTFLQGKLNMKTVIPWKTQRLTSLEDEVIQEQKIREMLCLYRSSKQVIIWEKTTNNQKHQTIQVSLTHTSLQSQNEIQAKNEQSIWAPLLGGLALTSVLVGGFKLLRMVIG